MARDESWKPTDEDDRIREKGDLTRSIIPAVDLHGDPTVPYPDDAAAPEDTTEPEADDETDP